MLHPYDSIQQAIDVVEDGNTIIVQQGTYTGLGNRDIDFKGLAITVRSADPNNPNVVAATVIDCQGSESEPHRGFYFHNSENSDSVLNGLTITNGYASGNWPNDSGGAIFCYTASPTIRNCVINGNKSSEKGGGLNAHDGNPTVVNCIFHNNASGAWDGSSYAWGGAVYSQSSSILFIQCIFSNNFAITYGGGIAAYDSNVTLRNCTFYGNQTLFDGGAMRIYNCSSTLENSILWYDMPNELYVGGASPTITYSNVQGGYGGTGNINCDPLFADAANGDYHLKSEAGRWDPHSESWVIDEVTSLCIDAGDSGSDWAAELWPHGKRINMGAYGGTPQASMSSSDAGNIADVSNNGLVDYIDLMMLTNKWLYEEVLLSEDLDRKGSVNFTDFVIFANNWLWEE